MHGPHELRIAGTPAHALRNRQCIECGLHHVREQRCGFSAGLGCFEVQELSLAFVDASECLERYPATVGERGRSPSRLALLVEGSIHWRTAALDALFALSRGERADQYRESARRSVGDQFAVCDARRSQSAAQAFRQGSLQFRQRQRRQLLGAKFEQEIFGLCGVAHVRTPDLSIGNPSASRDS